MKQQNRNAQRYAYIQQKTKLIKVEIKDTCTYVLIEQNDQSQ